MTTSNMSLTLPQYDITPGSVWTGNINDNFQIIDEHDHISAGKRLSSNAFIITDDIDYNFKGIKGCSSVVFDSTATPQLLTRMLYQSNGDLYYKDHNGNDIRLTASGNINVGGLGAITGMDSTSSVAYSTVLKTFTFTQSSGVVGKIACGTVSISHESTGAQSVKLKVNSANVGYDFIFDDAAPETNKYLSFSSASQVKYKTIQGTANQITVTHNTNDTTFSIPTTVNLTTINAASLNLTSGNSILNHNATQSQSVYRSTALDGSGGTPAIELIGMRADDNLYFDGRIYLGAWRNNNLKTNQYLGGVMFGGQVTSDGTYSDAKQLYSASIDAVATEERSDADHVGTALHFRVAPAATSGKGQLKNHVNNRPGDLAAILDETGLTVMNQIVGRGTIPIGTIIPTLKGYTGAYSCTATTAADAQGFVLCAGQTISDVTSPMNGQVIPNLTDGRFLRGSSTTGGTGGSDTVSTTHTHTVSLSLANMPIHTHTINHDHGVVTSSGQSQSHTHTVLDAYSYDSTANSSTGASWPVSTHTSTTRTTSNANQDHTHTVDLPDFTGNSGSSGGVSAATTSGGSMASITVIPKYLNVIYICRIK